MSAVVHVAGPYADLVQHCVRCGEVLTDYRNAYYPAGEPPPRGWAEGEELVVDARPGMVRSAPRSGWTGPVAICSAGGRAA